MQDIVVMLKLPHNINISVDHVLWLFLPFSNNSNTFTKRSIDSSENHLRNTTRISTTMVSFIVNLAMQVVSTIGFTVLPKDVRRQANVPIFCIALIMVLALAILSAYIVSKLVSGARFERQVSGLYFLNVLGLFACVTFSPWMTSIPPISCPFHMRPDLFVDWTVEAIAITIGVSSLLLLCKLLLRF